MLLLLLLFVLFQLIKPLPRQLQKTATSFASTPPTFPTWSSSSSSSLLLGLYILLLILLLLSVPIVVIDVLLLFSYLILFSFVEGEAFKNIIGYTNLKNNKSNNNNTKIAFTVVGNVCFWDFLFINRRLCVVCSKKKNNKKYSHTYAYTQSYVTI